MTNKEFKVGDRVQVAGGSQILTIKTINSFYATFEEECIPIRFANLRLVDPSPQSPVKTVTRQEIVPGVYGCVTVVDVNYTNCLDFRHQKKRVFIDIKGSLQNEWLDATELEQAAQVFLDLAKALRENEK